MPERNVAKAMFSIYDFIVNHFSASTYFYGMMTCLKCCIAVVCFCLSGFVKAQKIDSIYVHLYVDSLKKGVHNYINVDGKLSNGSYIPLSSKEINFSSNYGKWDGNSIIIDSAYDKDSVVIQVALKEQPLLKKQVTVYIKKVIIPEALPTTDELLERWKKEAKKSKSKN